MASEIVNRDGLYGYVQREQDGRRVERDERKTYDIKALWQRSHEIINLAVRGFKQTEIAEMLGINPQTDSNTLNSELGMRRLAELRLGRDQEAEVVAAKVRDLRDKALQVYNEVFEDNSGEMGLRDKVKVADTVLLELSGLRVPTKIQSAHVTLTAQELEEFKLRGIAAAREAGLLAETNERDEPIVVEAKVVNE